MFSYSPLLTILILILLRSGGHSSGPADLPVNAWIRLTEDQQGARRNSSFRYVEDGGYFLLWGYMGHVTDDYGNPEQPWRGNNEYDIVIFDPRVGRWLSQYPQEKENEWRNQPPPMHLCNSYQGITTGSYRPQLKVREGVLRPDLNIVFDQVTYDAKRAKMIYFTGGRTFAYDVRSRKWSNAAPNTPSPPPVSAASLCYDSFNDEAVLAGGGHVAEKGAHGELAGYTSTWLYECSRSLWRPLGARTEPPPRMNTRLVCDTKNKVLVMFGGDGQSQYLADTWIYETRARQWRQSKAAAGPPPRAGHFTVYDPGTGWIIIGGGYNRQNLTDMWAYDAAADRWTKLKGEVPTGWHIAADLVPRESLIILTTSNKSKGDGMTCNEIYPVRATYAFKVRREGLLDDSVPPQLQQNMLKRSQEEATAGTQPDPERRRKQHERILSMPVNQWVRFDGPGRTGALRTWGSCSFDTDKIRIIYWGGGHCGYGGSDYDLYDVEQNTWIASPVIAEYPERAWDRGINAAGVTFGGAPFVRHGRKVYAYDPVSKLIINTKTILLTAGYEPDLLRHIEPINPNWGTGEDFMQSSYRKWVTTTYDPSNERLEVLCSGMPGLDLTVTTPRGVMGVDHYWDIVESKMRTNAPNSVYLLDVARRQWKKLPNPGPWPQNLYEMTALVYDSRRDQLILHGGGPQRDELWVYRLPGEKWQRIEPQFASGVAGKPPACRREAVYLPRCDVMLTAGSPVGTRQVPALYAYHVGENRWYKLKLPLPPGKKEIDLGGQNRAWAYDPKHDLVFMILGEGTGDRGKAELFALRYKHSGAELAK
jgi:hypothetical protein